MCRWGSRGIDGVGGADGDIFPDELMTTGMTAWKWREGGWLSDFLSAGEGIDCVTVSWVSVLWRWWEEGWVHRIWDGEGWIVWRRTKGDICGCPSDGE